MDNVKAVVLGGLVAFGLFVALRAVDSQHTAKPGCEADCDCEHAASQRNGLLPTRELPDGASQVKALGHGWVTFQLELAGYRRLFIYRRGGSITELEHAAQYVGGTGEVTPKPRPGDVPRGVAVGSQ